MKMLRKLVVLTFFAAFAASILSSCHGEKVDKNVDSATNYSSAMTEFSVPDGFDTSKEYEITFWAKSDSNKTQTEVYKKAARDFEKLYPNVKITIEIEMDYQRIYQNVITNIPSGTTPNVCITYPDHIATYLTGNSLVVPLEDLMNDDKYGLGGSELRFDGPTQDEIVDKFLDECVVNGYQYGLPFMRSTEACYVNKTYVEALGFELPEQLTWDFVWEVCRAATEKETVVDESGNTREVYAVNGQTVMLPFIYKSTDNMMIQMIEQMGGEYSTSEGDILIFNDTTEQILLEIAENAAIGSFYTFKNVSYPANYLNAGQCIFAIDSTAGSTWMGTNSVLSDIPEESVVDFETVVMEIPQYDTENPRMISQGPSICIFNKEDSGEVLASWLFAQYLLTNEVQIPYSQSEGYLPVTTKAQGSEEFLDYLSRSGEDNKTYYDVKIAATELIIKNIDNMFITPVFNGSVSLRNAAGGMIEEIADSVRVGKTITPAFINGVYRKMTALWRLNVELGEISASAVILITSILIIDVGIVAYLIYSKTKNKKQNKKSSKEEKN